jgi:hypothetical protein
MITALAIVGYLVGAAVTGRAFFIRKIRSGDWRKGCMDEDEYFPLTFSMALWPLALLMMWVTRSPKPTKQEEIDKLERELEM